MRPTHAMRLSTLSPIAAAVGGALLANLVIGVGLGAHKGTSAVVLLALLPAVLIVSGILVVTNRALPAYAALTFDLAGGLDFSKPLPIPGGTQIFWTDIVLLVALAGAVVAKLMPRPELELGRRLQTPVLRLPLLALAVTMVLGAVKGHNRYGASLIGQPVRLFLYAGIVVAFVGLRPDRAWRAITVIFYVGAVVQAFWAVYYIATGNTHAASATLSTGGIRILALSTSIYLTGSLLCALLNLELNRDRALRQAIDVMIALLALFGIVVSFGRTTYVAVAVIVPAILVVRRQLRRSILWLIPLFAPVLIVVALLVPRMNPELESTLSARLTKTNSNDINVVWRDRARAAAMEGVNREIVTGVGFGRETVFQINGQTVKIEGDPHNSYIYLLAGGGALALGAFLLLAGTYAVDAFRRLRASTGVSQALVTWCLGTWLAFMINTLAGPVFTDPTMLMTIWILMVLPSIVPLTRAASADAVS